MLFVNSSPWRCELHRKDFPCGSITLVLTATIITVISNFSTTTAQDAELQHTVEKRAISQVHSSRRILSNSPSSFSSGGAGGFSNSRSPSTGLGGSQNYMRPVHYEADCRWTVQGAHATIATDKNHADFEPKQCRAHIYRHSLYKQDFRLGYKLELVCYASGIPRPQITWKKGNKEITTQSSDNRHIHEYHIDDYSVKGKLEIDPSTQGDEGGYTCIASNAVGIDSKSFQAEFIKAT